MLGHWNQFPLCRWSRFPPDSQSKACSICVATYCQSRWWLKAVPAFSRTQLLLYRRSQFLLYRRTDSWERSYGDGTSLGSGKMGRKWPLKRYVSRPKCALNGMHPIPPQPPPATVLTKLSGNGSQGPASSRAWGGVWGRVPADYSSDEQRATRDCW